MRAAVSLPRTRFDEPILVGLVALLVVAGLTLGRDTPLMYLAAAVPIVVAITWARPVYGLALLLGLVMLAEEFEITTLAAGVEPLFQHVLPVFLSLDRFTPVPVKINVVELSLVLLAAVWAGQAVAAQRFRLKPIPCGIAWLASVAALAITFVVGVTTGGDLSTAIVEVRALGYFFVLAALVPQLVERRRDLVIVVGVLVAALGFKAVEGLYRYVVVLGMRLGLRETFMAHEDPIMFIPLIFLGIALWHYRTAAPVLRRAVLCAAPLMLIVLVLTQRRTSYVTLALSAVFWLFVLAPAARRTYLRIALPGVVAAAFYIAAFTGSTGALGRPIERFATLFDDRDASNLYRVVELQNLRYTIQTHPWGVGFGHPYEMYLPLPSIDLDFELYEHIPHNEILWIWVKAGTVGFVIVMFYFAWLIAESVWTHRHLRDPLLRAVTAVIGLAIVNQLVASYFDLQLTYARNMIYLGTLVGLLGSAREWSGLAQPVGRWRWRL